MRSTAESPDWHRYLAALAELRLAVKRNEDDLAFERDRKGRLVYLFDTNVVGLFMNPLAYRTVLTGFGMPSDSGHLDAASIMTAEYLFSRGLVGQGDTPAYLAPGHARELEGTLGRLKKNLAARSGVAIEDTPYEAKQLSRILQDDLMRPLHLLPEADTATLEPDERVVDTWAALLSEREQSSMRPSRGVSKMEAAAIAQVTMLNQQAQQTLQPSRYVLVTTDRAMLNAYARWYHRNGARGDFVLRHALQYSPILNAERMSGEGFRSESVQQIGEAIDSLFAVRSDGPDSYWTLLAGIAFDAASEEKMSWLPRISEAMEFLKYLENKWMDAGRSAVELNAHWLERHYERIGMVRADSSRVGTTPSRAKLLKSFEQSLLDVESFHAKFVANALLPPHKASVPRISSPEPLLMRSKRRTLKEVIDAEPADLGELRALDFGSGVRPWLLLARAACIAFRLGRWQAAAQWAQRALSLGGLEKSVDHRIGEVEGHELYYLFSAASKQVPDWNEYPTIRAQLHHSLDFFADREDEFGQARTLLQLAEMATSNYLLQSDQGDPPDPTLTATFIEAVDCIVSASRLSRGGKGPGRWAELRQRVDSAFLAIAMLDDLVVGTGSIPKGPIDALRNDLHHGLLPRGRSDHLNARIALGLLHVGDGHGARALGLEIEDLVRSMRNEVEKVRLRAIARALRAM